MKKISFLIGVVTRVCSQKNTIAKRLTKFVETEHDPELLTKKMIVPLPMKTVNAKGGPSSSSELIPE